MDDFDDILIYLQDIVVRYLAGGWIYWWHQCLGDRRSFECIEIAQRVQSKEVDDSGMKFRQQQYLSLGRKKTLGISELDELQK